MDGCLLLGCFYENYNMYVWQYLNVVAVRAIIVVGTTTDVHFLKRSRSSVLEFNYLLRICFIYVYAL